jgi:hypothetical protein
LTPNGKLYFACKSIHDPKYGEGEEVETDTFVRNGHIRHFFSEVYATELLKDSFRIDRLEEISVNYAGNDSMLIQCWAERL